MLQSISLPSVATAEVGADISLRNAQLGRRYLYFKARVEANKAGSQDDGNPCLIIEFVMIWAQFLFEL